jgi:hypothetical protein
MKKKLIITESQLTRLKQYITESAIHTSLVKQMKEELDKNYLPISKFVREGGDYNEQPMIQVKADEEVITPKDLYEYMKRKYGVGESFTQQVIRDWVDGKISKNYQLSKNVTIS